MALMERADDAGAFCSCVAARSRVVGRPLGYVMYEELLLPPPLVVVVRGETKTDGRQYTS